MCSLSHLTNPAQSFSKVGLGLLGQHQFFKRQTINVMKPKSYISHSKRSDYALRFYSQFFFSNSFSIFVWSDMFGR